MVESANAAIEAGPVSAWPRPLAFVLSGGGAYGASQVGMLQALLEAGVQPDLVVGASVGALNGALLASDPDTAIDRLTEIWLSMTRSELLGGEGPLSAIREVIRVGMHRELPGLFSLTALGELIDRHTGITQIENLPIDLAVVVTDALDGTPVVLNDGPLRIALQASASIPGVFQPVKHMGRYFIDGGVTANVPVRQAIDGGAASLVVLDCIPSSLTNEIPDSVIGSLLHASHIMLRNQPANADQLAASSMPVLRLPQTTPAGYHSIDFSRSEELIDLAYQASTQALADAND